MTECIYKSYQYKDKTYRTNEYQINLFNRVKSLPVENLHYIVCQQKNQHANLNIKQMKSSLRRGVRRYLQESVDWYSPSLERVLVPFLCVFESGKEFHNNQSNPNLESEDFDFGLHFHLFVSGNNKYPVDFNRLSEHIEHELRAIRKKRECISKYDCRKVDKLNEPFIYYHTKQLYRLPTNEMTLTNLA